MIIGIRGKQGNGKTATLAWLEDHYKKQGYKIYSNFWRENIDFTYVTCLQDIDKIHSGYAFFDEFWTWIDSRVSGYSDVNMAVTSILMNARKRGYSIFYEAKLIHMVDRRIRELTDYILEPNVYIEVNGSLERIQQTMLWPFDTKPYIDDLWVIADKYEVISENNLRKIDEEEDEIMFRLSDVIDTYDTTEEIKGLSRTETTPGLEKGMKVENAFSSFLKGVFPSGEILLSDMSRGWDVILKNNGDSRAFDVVTASKQKTSKNYSIDIRRKDKEGLLKKAKKGKLKPFWAFHVDGKWFNIPMAEEHIHRSYLNCKDGKLIESMTNS
jgi:hypothetical protein